jgi:hypothetical protein
VLFGFAARGESLIPAIESLLGGPRVSDGGGRRPFLAPPQGVADEGVMAIMPGRFHEDAAEMGVAGFGDAAAGLLRPAGMLRGDQADEGHEPGCSRKATRVAEFGGDGERGQVVDPAEAAKSLDARAERLESEERPQVLFDGVEPCDRFIDGAEIGAMGLVERRQRPRLGAEPGIVPLRPRLPRGRKATAVAEEKFRQSMAGAQQIGADVFAVPQQITRGLLLLGGDVNRGQRAARKRIASCPASRRSVLMRSPGRRGISAGAITSHGIPCCVSARCNSKPHGPAS